MKVEEQTVKNRLEEALQIRGMKQVDLVERTGIKKSSINGWVKNRYQPKHHAVYLLAQALDVSEMWLAGYDAPMERSPEQKKMDELAKLIHKLRKNEKLQSVCVNISMLDDDQLDAVDTIIAAMKR